MIDDEEECEKDRTTAIGLFHFAHSYAMSASALCDIKLHSTHPDSPIRYLYSHAIELYLKAYLLMNGITLDELRSRALGHRMSRLADKAISFGLAIDSVQRAQIELLNQAIDDRYIKTGSRTVLPNGTLHGICVHLHHEIGPKVYERSGITRQVIQLLPRD